MPDRPAFLRKQLLVWLFVPLSALLVADAVVSYWVALSFSQRAYDRSLVEIARDLTLHLRPQPGGIALDLPEAARRVLFSDPDDAIHFEVSTEDGKLAAGERLPAAPHDTEADQRRERLYGAEVTGMPMRVVELRTEVGSAPNASRMIVRVAETQHKRTGLAWEILLSVLIPQILLILIAGVVVWIGVVYGLAPLSRVQEAVALRSARDFRPVELGGVPGELRPLVQSINELLERLEAALTLQSRFIADAAHQLKTPVAALQAQLELAARENDAERIRENLRRACTGLDRLSRLVSQLLSLARNEPQATPAVQLVALDLNALTLEATTRWVPEALKKRIDLGFEGIETGVMVHGEPGRLHELLDNLLDNAVRYTHEGGRVTVCVSDDDAPTIAINDDGPSIPAEERERVFQRFHRLLGSPRDGSGLGLSIAQEIARLHGATISLRDDADGIGNTFSISFPPAAAQDSRSTTNEISARP